MILLAFVMFYCFGLFAGFIIGYHVRFKEER